MAKLSRGPPRPNKKLTDFFSKSTTSSATSSSAPSSSQPPSSSPIVKRELPRVAFLSPQHNTVASPFTPTDRRQTRSLPSAEADSSTRAQKLKAPALTTAPPDVISVSSGSTRSHISIADTTRSHISIADSTRSHITVSSGSSGPEVPITPSSPLRPVAEDSSSMVSSRRSTRLQPRAMDVPSSVPSVFKDSTGRRTTSSAKRKDRSEDEPPREESVIIIKRDPMPVRAPIPPTRSKKASSNASHGPLVAKENIATTPKSAQPTRSSPRKKMKMTPPATAEDEERIPSSQSDEHEMSPPRLIRKDPAEVKQAVDEWRKQTAASPPAGSDDVVDQLQVPMAIDAEGSSPLPPLSPEPAEIPTVVSGMSRGSSSEVDAQLHFSVDNATLSTASHGGPVADPDVEMSRAHTPPPADAQLANVTATPQALDAESKAAHIIAQIKAKVYARSPLSDDDRVPRVLGKLESESEEEDLDFFALARAKAGKGKGKERIVSPVVAGPSAPEASTSRSTRYSLRRRQAARTESDDEAGGSSLPPLPSLFATKSKGKAKAIFKPRGKSGPDPLDMLLKEKRHATKTGRGADALRRAEDAIAASSDVDDMDVDDASHADGTSATANYNDEAAAMRAMRTGAKLGWTSSSPRAASPHGSMEFDLDGFADADKERLLGAKNAKAIGQILKGDRALKGKASEEGKEELLGVPFWASLVRVPGPASDKDGKLPPIEGLIAADHPLLSLLDDAVTQNDGQAISMVLNSGMLSALHDTHISILLPWLCHLALSDSGPALVHSVIFALPTLLQRGQRRSVSALKMALATLVALDAKKDVLEAMGWLTPVSNYRVDVSHGRRSDTLHRLRTLLTILAKAKVIEKKEVADIITALLLVALDTAATGAERRHTMLTIDAIGRNLSEDANETEAAVSAKIVAFASNQTPANQVFLFSVLTGGCTQMARIARWTAHALLTGESAPPYSALPPLPKLLELLSGPFGSEGIFAINAKTDYEDLGFRMDVLAVALTDVEGYANEERAAARAEAAAAAAPEASPRKINSEKLPTPLEAIRYALDVIHGQIVDTRAAHLDRSRTKAAIQRLEMRVHYQRSSAQEVRAGGPRGKPRRLHDFFPASSSSNSRT